jgi:DNA-binding transcriptional regulator/RsmH inhibitor MraZ
MFAGEFQSRAEAGGLFRLPPIFLAAFPLQEEVVGRQVVVLKSLDRSLWLYQAQSWEAKLTAVLSQSLVFEAKSENLVLQIQ